EPVDAALGRLLSGGLLHHAGGRGRLGGRRGLGGGFRRRGGLGSRLPDGSRGGLVGGRGRLRGAVRVSAHGRTSLPARRIGSAGGLNVIPSISHRVLPLLPAPCRRWRSGRGAA